MAKEKFKIKARIDAPDMVSQGNHSAQKIGGSFETDHPQFAAFIEERYGVVAPKRSPRKKTVRKRATTKPASSELPAANNAPEGGTE